MRPELPDYGTFPRSPDNGTSWIHPDDRSIVTSLIPSERIYRRDRFDGTFYHFRYGDIRFRLRPCMWLPLAAEGVDVGDLVEIIGTGMDRERFVGNVVDALYSTKEERCVYRIVRPGAMESERLYGRDDFQNLTDKSKIREGSTIHPVPRWHDAFRDDPSGQRIQLAPDVKPDDRADQ